MNRALMRWWKGAAAILLCAAVLAGCGRGENGARQDARDARNRQLRRALAAKQVQDIDGAIEWCLKALERRPNLALAHRELALMYDNYIEDYELAIYHYRRYLDLRPDSEQREAVEDLIRHCRVSIAKGIADSPAEWRRDLEARNNRIRNLETEVAALRAAAGSPASTPPASARPAASPTVTPVAAPAARTHVVQAGETLGTIAQRYYGSPAHWNRIFEANRDVIRNPNNLRIGTTLTIPPT